MLKDAVYIYGFAKGAGLPLTLKAVTWAERLHRGAKRNDESDYITHPLKVCRTLINNGIRDDKILAASLLHDVLEETKITLQELILEFGEEVANIVDRLSKKERISSEEYYREIAKDIRAVLIKAADRACNVGDMIKVYTLERLERYVAETEKYVLPMMKEARRNYLEYSDVFIVFRDIINDILNAAKDKVIPLMRENEALKAKIAELEAARE